MAPALTPAEILARRKNYATAVIKAQNPPPKTPSKMVKQFPAVAEVEKPGADEDRRAKLHKWMEEKKRRDMEATRQKSRQHQQPPTKPQNSTVQTKKNSGADLGSKPAMLSSGVKQSKSETATTTTTGVKKVAFDSVTCTSKPTKEGQKSSLHATPRRTSHATPSRRPPYATPSRLSAKKFETLSPDSKFGHWLQLKGKTPQQVNHIGCVTPAAKSTSKKKKSSVSFAQNTTAKVVSGLDSEPAEGQVKSLLKPPNDGKIHEDAFFDLLNLLEEGLIANSDARAELAKLCDATEKSSRQVSRYWLCRAHLAITSDGSTKPERARETFRLLEEAVVSGARPNAVLAEGAKRLVLRLCDLLKDQDRENLANGKNGSLDGTFTMETEDKCEKNGTFTKDQVEASSLTPPASPGVADVDESLVAGPDSPVITTAIPTITAAPAFPGSVLPTIFPASPEDDSGSSAVASTPIAPQKGSIQSSPATAALPAAVSAAEVETAKSTSPPPPVFSLSFVTPTRPVALGEPLSPPLSDDEDDNHKIDGNNNSNDGDNEEIDSSNVEAKSTAVELPVLPSSPISVSAELVTTSPHFIGIRHSQAVAETADIVADYLHESTIQIEGNAGHVLHNNTSATSGCSSLHDVTNVSTWANFDSNESLEVVELTNYLGPTVGRTEDDDDNDVERCDAVIKNLELESFSEMYLTGESSAESSTTGLATAEEADVSVNVDEVVELLDEEVEEISEEEANKENISPEGVPDVCRDTDLVLLASPIFQDDREPTNSPYPKSQRVRQPFASSTVKLLVKDDIRANSIPDDENLYAGNVSENIDADNEENLPPSSFDASQEEGNAVTTTMTTPPLSRKSLLKSASKVVVTPVRRSVRQTPRAKATEEKRRLIEDMDDLSPGARKNSIFIPNDTILNLSFGNVDDEDDDRAEVE